MRVAPARQDLPAGTSCSSFYRFRWSRTGRSSSSLNCQCADRSGAAGARTPNLRRARAALSQLSYDPRFGPVGAPGLEPGTSALSGPRSDHLSYAPVATPSGWSSSNTVWRPDSSGYLCPRRSARSRPIARSVLGYGSLRMSAADTGSWLSGIPLAAERLCQDLNPQGDPRGSVPRQPASSPHRLTSG